MSWGLWGRAPPQDQLFLPPSLLLGGIKDGRERREPLGRGKAEPLGRKMITIGILSCTFKGMRMSEGRGPCWRASSKGPPGSQGDGHRVGWSVLLPPALHWDPGLFRESCSVRCEVPLGQCVCVHARICMCTHVCTCICISQEQYCWGMGPPGQAELWLTFPWAGLPCPPAGIASSSLLGEGVRKWLPFNYLELSRFSVRCHCTFTKVYVPVTYLTSENKSMKGPFPSLIRLLFANLDKTLSLNFWASLS